MQPVLRIVFVELFTQKGGLKAHVARLAQIGASTTDNALATAIDSYLREVGYSD